jgi:hypothetical protein
MNYELAKALKDAGFPQNTKYGAMAMEDGGRLGFPTLEELIEACGDRFGSLEKTSIGIFSAYKKNDMMVNGIGATPTDAVAKLFLALKGIDSSTI